MKDIILFVIVIVLIALVGMCVAAEYVSENGSIAVNANTLSLSKTVVKAKGKVILQSNADGVKINANCDEIKLVPMTASKKTGLESIKEAVFTGNIIFTYNDSSKSIKCIGYSDSAYYDGVTQTVTLKGDVKMDYFSGTGDDMSKMVATGEVATVNIAKNLSDDQLIFSIQGDNNKVKLIATPKAVNN